MLSMTCIHGHVKTRYISDSIAGLFSVVATLYSALNRGALIPPGPAPRATQPWPLHGPRTPAPQVSLAKIEAVTGSSV